MPTKTFPVTACLPVTLTGEHNPGDLHIPMGKWAAGTGWSGRVLLKASISFADMATITSAYLRWYRHTAAGYHAGGASTVTAHAHRKTADWSEGSGGGGTGTDEIWSSGASSGLVEGNYAGVESGDSGDLADGSDGSLEFVEVTAIARKWLSGSPNYGVMIRILEEASAAYGKEFYSRRVSGRVPYFEIEYETNQAPNAPTNLSPSGNETVHTGRSITYSGTRSDPDSGDSITTYEIEVYVSGGGLIDEATVFPDGNPTSFSKTMTLPSGYVCDRSYEWRARTRDEGGLWGPWSAKQKYRPNTVPATPAAPTVATDTRTPTITGSFTDPDPGNSPASAEIEVRRASDSAPMWDSGAFTISSSPWTATYGVDGSGSAAALQWGQVYQARCRVKDDLLGWSSWSAWRTFTPTQPIGPDAMTPRDLTTKQQTLTPTLTVGHSAQFRNDDVEVYAGPTTGSVRLWAKPWAGADYALTLTKAYVYAGTALAWGGTYYWRARVEDGAGVISEWSPLMPFYVNAEPTAPSQLAARDAAGAPVTVSGSVYAVTTPTPILEAVFGDPDLDDYADRPTSRTVEIFVRNSDGSPGALKGTNTLASPPYAVPMTYLVPGAAGLVVGGEYLVRWRFSDNAGRASPWSAYMTLRVTTAPVVALVSPANGAALTDSTPFLDWTFTPAAGKTQAAYQVQLFETGALGVPYPDGEQLVHDSGVIASAASSYQVPPQVVSDDRSYRWQVYAWDSDGLRGVLA